MLSIFGRSYLSDVEHLSDSDDEDFLTNVSQDLYASENVGPPKSEKLAKITNKHFESELTIEKLKAIRNKYKRPANCELLSVPKVNPEIWGQLPGYAKKKDRKLANLQDTLTTSFSAISSSLNVHKPECRQANMF